MTHRTITRENSHNVAGAYFRAVTAGPERALVEWFLDQRLFPTPRGCKTTLLIEPSLESGFPDVVLVHWHAKTADNWSLQRKQLDSVDLKILHYLSSVRHSTHQELVVRFPRILNRRLERLLVSGLIRRTKDLWIARPIQENFAVRSIIALEAKITNWQSAVRQAVLNKWFANESYVLLPSIPNSGKFIAEIDSHQIGVVTQNDCAVRKPLLVSNGFPRSYASWLLNEWVCLAEMTPSECDFYETGMGHRAVSRD